ncbi:MAG: ribonuclease J [Chloroflexi bacterium]|nr:ribonuclease J [Chloroflexota bacterium]
MAKERLKVIPLGGLGEIGKNMTALEYGDDIMVVDAGLMFPEEEMLGVDLVIPDITYLLENQGKIRGIVITHGHEDHTGALPYILPRLKAPVYATPLTHGLISVKLKEQKALHGAKLNVFQSGSEIVLGKFRVNPYHVSHSIPDAVGLVIQTPVGVVVYSGDFKLDYTPVDGKPTDFAKLARLGAGGVLLLLSDSTYVEEPGYTPSERIVGESLDRIMGDAPGRVIVATFASLISRIQQVIDAAEKHGKRLFIVGRSMSDNVQMARELGYLRISPDMLGKIEELRRLPPDKVAIILTGTQGEPTSALVRMANRDHPHLRVLKGDTIVVSASPIPGNEAVISRTLDNLFREGAQVLYSRVATVHVHGHGSQEDLKMMMSLVKPRFFVPIHGEYRHLVLHTKLAQSLGIPASNTFVMEDGDVLEVSSKSAKVVGKVSSNSVYVDGLGVGDIGNVVLRDRRLLSRDGFLIVIIAIDKKLGSISGRPDILSRGFVDPSEADALYEECRRLVIKALDRGGERLAESSFVSSKVKDTLGKFVYEQTKRRPMILPVVMEV